MNSAIWGANAFSSKQHGGPSADGNPNFTASARSIHLHPLQRRISVDLLDANNGDRIEQGHDAHEGGVEAQLLGKPSRIKVRLHQQTLQRVLDSVSLKLTTKPVATGDYYSVSLHDVQMQPVVGGLTIDAPFDVHLTPQLPLGIELDRHIRAKVKVTSAPLWVEDGKVFVRIQNADVIPDASYHGHFVAKSIEWIEHTLKLDKRLQDLVQKALDDELNGKSLLQLLTAGRGVHGHHEQEHSQGRRAPGGDDDSQEEHDDQVVIRIPGEDDSRRRGVSGSVGSGGGIYGDFSSSSGGKEKGVRQSDAEAQASEATVGHQPSHAGDTEAFERYGPPPAVSTALEYVDVDSARGAILMSEESGTASGSGGAASTGHLVLEVVFSPTPTLKKRTRLIVGVAAGVVLFSVAILIAVIVRASKRD
jgi:hypothetical protein